MSRILPPTVQQANGSHELWQPSQYSIHKYINDDMLHLDRTLISFILQIYSEHGDQGVIFVFVYKSPGNSKKFSAWPNQTYFHPIGKYRRKPTNFSDRFLEAK